MRVSASASPTARGRRPRLSYSGCRRHEVDLDPPVGMGQTRDEQERRGRSVRAEELLADLAGGRQVLAVHQQHVQLDDVGDRHPGSGEHAFDVAPHEARLLLDVLAIRPSVSTPVCPDPNTRRIGASTSTPCE